MFGGRLSLALLTVLLTACDSDQGPPGDGLTTKAIFVRGTVYGLVATLGVLTGVLMLAPSLIVFPSDETLYTLPFLSLAFAVLGLLVYGFARAFR